MVVFQKFAIEEMGEQIVIKINEQFQTSQFLGIHSTEKKTSLKNVKTVFPISQPHSFIDGGTNTPLWATTIFEYLTI